LDVSGQRFVVQLATLLHMCADYDEIEIARWLLDRGMNVDQQTAVDPDGFGGHTALFATVVSQPNFWMNLRGHVPEPAFTRLLLDHGANPNRRASLRKQLEYRNVTPIGWGEKFHFKKLVNLAAIALIAERGGQP
jgi:ankyrin repeat protein